MLRSTENLIYALRATDPRREDRRYQTEWKRQQRETRRAAGLCIICGSSPPSDDLASCAECRIKLRAGQGALRDRRRAEGRCIRCGSLDHTSGDHFGRIRDGLTAAGKCIQCRRRPPFRDRRKCRRCLRADAERQAARRVR